MENNTVPATGKRIALITGASSGMGREFVLALDRQEKFDELWLVARRRERLAFRHVMQGVRQAARLRAQPAIGRAPADERGHEALA